MGLLDRIFGARGDVPVVLPRGFRQTASSDTDTDPEIIDGADVEDAEIDGLAIAIHYKAADGSLSQRAVVCRNYRPGPPAIVGGHCQLRDDYRCFRVDRIQALVDMSTGEVREGDEIGCFFAPFEAAGAADERARTAGKLMKQAGPAAKLLAYLALADGQYAPAERRVIVDFVMANAQRWIGQAEVDPADIDAWVGNLRPRRRTAETAVRTLATDREFFPELARAMIDLVRADGIVDPAEEKAVRGIIALVRAEMAGQGQPEGE